MGGSPSLATIQYSEHGPPAWPGSADLCCPPLYISNSSSFPGPDGASSAIGAATFTAAFDPSRSGGADSVRFYSSLKGDLAAVGYHRISGRSWA